MLWRRLRTPIRVALSVSALIVLAVSRNRHVIVVVLLATFAVAAIGRRLIVLVRARRAATGEGRATALIRLVRRDPGYWGGQISHIGVAVLAVGIGVSANLATSGSIDLHPGDRVSFAGYSLAYEGPFSRSEPTRTVIGARVEVQQEGRVVTVLEPRLNDYGGPSGPVITPAVHSSFRGDLYISLTRLDGAGRLHADVWAYPLQWMIWLGGLITASGAAFSLTAAGRRARARPAMIRA